MIPSKENCKVGDILRIVDVRDIEMSGIQEFFELGDLAIVTDFWGAGPKIIIPGKLPNNEKKLIGNNKGFGFYWRRFERTGERIEMEGDK